MPVLTQQEYKKKKQRKSKKKTEKPAERAISIEQKRLPSLSEKKQLYVFQHPEIPLNGTINRSYEIELNGKKKLITIKNGQVKTEDKDIAEYLKKREYILLDIIMEDKDGKKNK